MKKCLAPLKEKKENMELVIALMGKDLLLSRAIKKELVNVKKKKCVRITKNLYYFLKEIRDEFIAKYDSIYFDCSCLNVNNIFLRCI